MSARPRNAARRKATEDSSRLLPLAIACVVCFATGILLGYTGWYFFGTHRAEAPAEKANLVMTPSTENPVDAESTPAPPSDSASEKVLAPTGEVPVAGGEIALGGEGTGMPLRRELLSPFAMGETEVTNEQYQDFVKATNRSAPAHWKNNNFPTGTAAEPVTNVTWQDATDYCRWLSEKLGATVRLPSEAEWERAARGEENYKYPWGNEWNPQAAESVETKGRVRPVKSFPAGRSPFGAYDMAGNVWEWVADQARDEEGQPKSKNGTALRIIKGGSAEEPSAFISAVSRFEAAEDKASRKLGFRYVVVRDKN